MKFNIVSTGSKGNAVVIEDIILIDVGIPFKQLSEVLGGIKLILLTHIHSDHFNKATIKKIAFEKPNIRWLCGEWLVADLVKLGVQLKQIDLMEMDKQYSYSSSLKISPVKLTHNVPNCGYKIFVNDMKLFYATDTGNLDGIEAKGYDLYMVESNHETNEILQRIKYKLQSGEYSYETEAIKNHLSKEKADEFIYANIGPNSQYIYMHQHEERD